MPLSAALAQCDLESAGNPDALTSGATACTPQGGRGLFQNTSLDYYEKYNFSTCQAFDSALCDAEFNTSVWRDVMTPLMLANDLFAALEYYNQGPNWNGKNWDYVNAILVRVPAYENV